MSKMKVWIKTAVMKMERW